MLCCEVETGKIMRQTSVPQMFSLFQQFVTYENERIGFWIVVVGVLFIIKWTDNADKEGLVFFFPPQWYMPTLSSVSVKKLFTYFCYVGTERNGHLLFSDWK